MDFDLKYDGGILVKEFFLQEGVKGKFVSLKFITHVNSLHKKASVWVYLPDYFEHYPLSITSKIKLFSVEVNTPNKLYVIVGYIGLINDSFTFQVRRANILERVGYWLKNKFKWMYIKQYK